MNATVFAIKQNFVIIIDGLAIQNGQVQNTTIPLIVILENSLSQIVGNDVSHFLNVTAKIRHLNAWSFYPKIDVIRSIVDKNYFDNFCVSETWLHEYIKDDEIHIPGIIFSEGIEQLV